MLRVSLRNITGRIWTLLLTALAVVLGTAFVAAAFVFTDSISATFDDLFASAAEGTDVIVRGEPGAETAQAGTPRAPLPLDLAERIADVDGVERVLPDIQGTAVLVGADGTAVRTGGAPSLGVNYSDDDPALQIVEGRAPEGPDEVALETSTLERSGLEVGDTTQVLVGPDPREVTVVGRADFGAGLAGATIVLLDRDTAERVYAADGTVTSFFVGAEEGTDLEALMDRIEPVLPERAEVATAQAVADEDQESLAEQLGFLNTFLVVIGAVALLVGAFVIFNVFSMLLARRTRELALLRAVGASSGQVLGSVLVEAAVVGLVGGVIGLGVGLLIAWALQGLIATLGLEISGGLPITATTVATTVVVGVVVTVVSAVLPALRAAQVPPVAALRDDVALPERQVRARAAFGLSLAAVGAAALLLGLFADVPEPLWWVGLGVLGVFLGVFVAAPFIARPVVWLVSVPAVALWGTVGRLARQNALRNPRRTAATAGALMVGTALVGAAAVITSSITASISSVIDDELTADFVLSAGGQAAFSPAVADDVAEVDGVATTVPLRVAPVTVLGGADGDAEVTTSLFVGAADPSAVLDTVDVTVVEGEFSTLGADEIVVPDSVAEDRGYSLGDVITARVGAGGPRDLTVVGIYEQTQVLGVEAIISQQAYEESVRDAERGDFFVYLTAEEDADLAALRDRLADAVSPYLVVSVLDADEFTGQQTQQVNQILGVITALLGLSLVVAVIGIVITLVLSVVERQREIGLLRAVGLSRAQLRRTVTLEGVATSVFGALLGVTLGLAFGLALQRALADQGLEVLSIPWAALIAMLVGGVVIGAAAAFFPARWASRRDVLEAIATE